MATPPAAGNLSQPRTVHELAYIDELTGLPNRARFNEALEWQIANNSGNFGLSFVDINGLKQVNDTEGHGAGDTLIKSAGATLDEAAPSEDKAAEAVGNLAKPLHRVVAETISKTIRRKQVGHDHDRRHEPNGEDRVFRLSGDEFVIILAGADTPEKVHQANARIIKALKTKEISASIGGRPHQDSETGAELLHDVDQIMYANKRRFHHQEYRRKALALPVYKFVGHVASRKLNEWSGNIKPPGER